MALIKVSQYIENDVYKLLFSIERQELSEDDRKRMRKYGEPYIQLGGTFLDSTPNEFTLPEKTIKLGSGFPYLAEFDSETEPFDTNTKTKVEAYRDEILSRIDDAFETLRDQVDTFTGEHLHNI